MLVACVGNSFHCSAAKKILAVHRTQIQAAGRDHRFVKVVDVVAEVPVRRSIRAPKFSRWKIAANQDIRPDLWRYCNSGHIPPTKR